MFKLEINCIEDFLIFVNVIRNEDLNSDKIKELIKSINESDSRLREAVNSQKQS